MTEKETFYEKRFLVNPKIIGLIFLLVLGFQAFLYLEPESDGFPLFEVLNILIILVMAFSSFVVAKKYEFSNIFGRSYFALGLGVVFLLFGHLTFKYYEYVLGIDPYPSIADVFYFSLQVAWIYHLQKNIRFFKGPLNIPTKILTICIPVIIVLIYVSSSLPNPDEITFDFVIGLLYISVMSVTMSLAVLGGIVFRQNILVSTWFLIVISIFLFTVAEVWYLHLEIFGLWNPIHPVNSLYVASNYFMMYALFKHLKAI